MKVKIENFRHYSGDYIFEGNFSCGLTLLSGSSGIGKSTILNAIAWCLYGYPKTVLPHNFETLKKARPYVLLEIDDLKIERYKRPELLRVTILSTGKVHIDDEAQAIINKQYGSLSVWKSCCYLGQGERNALLSLSNQERFDILNYLTFQSDTSIFEQYYEKIDAYTNKLTGRYTELNQQLALSKGSIEKRYPDLAGKAYKNITVELLEEKIALFQEEKDKLKDRQKIREQKLYLLNSHNNTLNSLKNRLNINVNIGEHNQTIKALTIDLSYMSLWQRCHNLKLELDRYSNVALPEVSYTRKDLEDAVKEEESYSKFKAFCTNYSLPTNIEKFLAIKAAIIGKYANLNIYRTLNELAKLESDTSIVGNDISTIKQKILDLEVKKNDIRQSANILSCPHCDGKLHYINSCLIKSDRIDIVVGDISSIDEEIRLLRTMEAKIERIMYLKTQLSDNATTLKPISSVEITKLAQIYPNILPINPVEEPKISSSSIRANLELVNKHQKLLQLQSNYRELSSSLPEGIKDYTNDKWQYIQKTKERLEKELSDYISITARIKQLQEEIDKISVDIPDDNKAKLEELSTKIAKASQLLNYIHEDTEYNKKKDNCTDANERLTKLASLKKLIIDFEHEYLSNTVNAINGWLSIICPKLFVDSIEVQLSLYKTAKTTGRVKPDVHLSITYRGIQIDNINCLSGGENDRLSLALTLALNKVASSSNGFLLLDETMSSLDEETRSTCLEVIREVCTDIPVITILHDTTTGAFDHLLKLDA